MRVRRAILLLGGLLLLVNLPAAVQAADRGYLGELKARARALDLAQAPQWLALGLYAPDMIGGGRSGMVDNPAFYLSPAGKTDPEAELLATLEAFFAPASAADPDSHPRCRKPARYRWLDRQLDFDPDRLPPRRCPAFEAWLADINPGQITLIFPAAYLNNPSSMFGHTLIRIDPPGQDPDVRLNSYAVNFAADHRGEQGMMFALKGLAGGYQGYFSLLHYYDKVAQYSDFENRDIWEYELAYTAEEVTTIVATIWEMDKQPIDYFFFTTNCSYVLLALLNVGRPELRAMDRFPLYAVPVDTIRALVETDGLLKRAVFRPSTRTRVRRAAEQLPPPQRDLALRLSAGDLRPTDPAVAALPAQQRAHVLELAQGHLQYRINTRAESGPAVRARSIRLLQARAALGGVAPLQTEPAEPPTRPDEGHATERLTFSLGATGTRPFAEVAFRFVYHDLLDPPPGFVDGAAITLGEGSVRFFTDDPPILETLTLISINSLSPRDDLFQPISWRTRLGFDRLREDGDDAGDIVFSLSGGAGPAWSLGDAETAIISPQLGAALYVDEQWPNDRLVGVGPSLDLVWQAAERWRLQVDAGAQFVTGIEERSVLFHGGLGQAFRLDSNLAVRLNAGFRNDGEETYGEWSGSVVWYF